MDSDKKTPLTILEKRQAKIEQLKAKLQKENARLSSSKRKERNGQLIAFGVYLESAYKTASVDARKKMQTKVLEFLDGRNKDRAFAGFQRLDEEHPAPAEPQKAP